MTELFPFQETSLRFLKDHPFSVVWDDMGLGKTRTLLLAAEGDTLVVAPAAVRDTRVWELEADRIGVKPPQVVSYHEIARMGPSPDVRPRTLILDEAHHAKNSKTSWHNGLAVIANRAVRVHQGTGTPMPNSANEIWGPFNLLYPDEHAFRYYWPWAEMWFGKFASRHADTYEAGTTLLGCRHKGDDAEMCEHWREFHEANIAGRAIRHARDDVLTELPPLTGNDDPLWTPMTATQKRAYASMKKDLLALIPDEGIELEALSATHQFSLLHQMASGVSIADPNSDPTDKHSGKLVEFADLIRYRKRPTLAVAWFRNSAAAIARVCAKQKKSYVIMGAATSRNNRAKAVADFSAGRFDVMVASIGVVKEGVDGLQRASDETILFERDWRPGVNDQVIRRLHRLGQDYPVTARQLITPKSVDSYQWDVLHDKATGIRRALRRAELEALL